MRVRACALKRVRFSNLNHLNNTYFMLSHFFKKVLKIKKIKSKLETSFHQTKNFHAGTAQITEVN